ncbi:MAG: ATP-binding protein [Thermoguttaceae bacterium]|jgi:signal transduction histidine kinase|nr:ATP-binding protein [Thermoguttaceae bacterium]
MKLPPEGARWLVSLRWLACVTLIGTIWFSSSVLGILADAVPLYVIAGAMVGYNLLFRLSQRDWAGGEAGVDRNIFLQVTCDLVALTLLLYFADLPRNPFLFYFTFHMIIAGMYLRGRAPYFFAGLASAMVGAVMLLEYLGWIPGHPLRYPSDADLPGGRPLDGVYLMGVYTAFASTVWIAIYFTTSIRRYVDRTHAELRQKEKLLGIGQLVAGIAHQIANPLDGLQNCLQRIGERVKNDPHLTEYVQLMVEALQRIERTAKRVQAFARPHGITLQPTDVNAAVEATLQVLGVPHDKQIRIERELGQVPPVQGDPYTLQEVLFNLCTNAIAAMPHGGTLTLRTLALGRNDEDQMGSVAVEVSDTGVGVARLHLEKIFEPFFTTRADRGGTGLGLSLCRMLISEMGGRIEVRSVLGQGTTFTVILNPADARRFPRALGRKTPAGEGKA